MKTNTKYSGIYEADNGTFYVSSRATTKDGYRIAFCKRGFLTKTEALNYKNIENERIKNSYKFQEQNKNIKFHDFMDMYLKEYSLSVVESTSNFVKHKIETVIKPNIPNYPMGSLKPYLFTRFRTSIASMDNCTSKTKNANLRVLKAILESARDKNYLDPQISNLCIQELSPVANDGHTFTSDFWEYEEFQAFINSFEDNDRFKLVFRTLFALGCRIGEFRGLKWLDLNTQDNTLHICRQVTSKLGKGSWVILERTKTKKDRYTMLPPKLVQELIEFKQTNKYADDDFLFFGKNPVGENTILMQKKKHCKLANVKYIRTHDFRHSNITYLIDKGVDIKLVANQVGHSNTSTTLNVYDHISDKRKEKLKTVLSDIDF